MNMDLLKQERNRGYVIAGIGGIVGFIAFFLPYVTVSVLGYGGSASGASGGWVWLEEIGAIVVIIASAVLIFRNNAFGLSNMPFEKQVLYGRYAILGGGVLALLIHLIFALDFQNVIGDYAGLLNGISLGFGFWVFLLAAIAMVVGGVLALRSPRPAAGAMTYQQPYQQYPQQQTQYPPYQQHYQQPYQQPYPPAEQQSQYPQQAYPPPPQQYPPTEMSQQPPQAYPPQQQGYPQQYPPTEPRQQQPPPQNPPQQSQW